MFSLRIRRGIGVAVLALTLIGAGGGAVAFGVGTSPGISMFNQEVERDEQSVARVDMFLNFGDIDGESKDGGHTNEIEIF